MRHIKDTMIVRKLHCLGKGLKQASDEFNEGSDLDPSFQLVLEIKIGPIRNPGSATDANRWVSLCTHFAGGR